MEHKSGATRSTSRRKAHCPLTFNWQFINTSLPKNEFNINKRCPLEARSLLKLIITRYALDEPINPTSWCLWMRTVRHSLTCRSSISTRLSEQRAEKRWQWLTTVTTCGIYVHGRYCLFNNRTVPYSSTIARLWGGESLYRIWGSY